MWKYILILCLVFTTLLNAEIKILAFSGSLRDHSLNKKLLNEAVTIATELGAQVTVIDLREYPMPIYDGDIEEREGMPATVKEFRKLIAENQLIFIASPNYNGSFSGGLKNVLDWASRIEEGGEARDVLQGKKIFIMSASTGKTGGIKGLPHLRNVLENLRGKVFLEQMGIPYADKAFDQTGKLIDPQLKAELESLIHNVIVQEQNAL